MLIVGAESNVSRFLSLSLSLSHRAGKGCGGRRVEIKASSAHTCFCVPVCVRDIKLNAIYSVILNNSGRGARGGNRA
jgi:hypothetical protein